MLDNALHHVLLTCAHIDLHAGPHVAQPGLVHFHQKRHAWTCIGDIALTFEPQHCLCISAMALHKLDHAYNTLLQGDLRNMLYKCSLVCSSCSTPELGVAVLQVDIQKTWVLFSSIVLAFAFMFGNSVKTVYESVIYLFVVHPFDVGDKIIADSVTSKVLLSYNGLSMHVLLLAVARQPAGHMSCKLCAIICRSGVVCLRFGSSSYE